MALTCPTTISGDFPFTEFIECATINISYDIMGIATVSFTVIAAAREPLDVSTYTSLIYGGVHFTGYVTNLEIRRVAGTAVYEHRYTMSMTGCPV